MPDVNNRDPRPGSWFMAGSNIWHPTHIHDHSAFRVGSVLNISDVLGSNALNKKDDGHPSTESSAGSPGERGGNQ